MSDLLQAKNLRKSFGVLQAVREASLQIAPGEIVAVMGRSGSGKTTLLHMLAGLERPTEGNIFYRGEDVASMDEDALALWRRANIGLVFQAFHLIPTLSAMENVAFPLYPMRLSTVERHARAEAHLDQVGLSDRAQHRPSHLSGGEQQRVAIHGHSSTTHPWFSQTSQRAISIAPQGMKFLSFLRNYETKQAQHS